MQEGEIWPTVLSGCWEVLVLGTAKIFEVCGVLANEGMRHYDVRVPNIYFNKWYEPVMINLENVEFLAVVPPQQLFMDDLWRYSKQSTIQTWKAVHPSICSFLVEWISTVDARINIKLDPNEVHVFWEHQVCFLKVLNPSRLPSTALWMPGCKWNFTYTPTKPQPRHNW